MASNFAKLYFPALDGLRFIASLNIVLLHFSTSSLLNYTKGGVIFSVISAPIFNASVFFVLSGFIYAVIFSSNARQQKSNAPLQKSNSLSQNQNLSLQTHSSLPKNPSSRIPSFKNFMKDRFFHLYPLHLICTLIVFAITLYRTNILDNPIYALKTLALHISLLWAFVPSLGYHLNQPSWTLSVFFLCYALTPAFSRVLNRIGCGKSMFLFILFWLILILIVVVFGTLPNAFRALEFFAGMSLGKLFLQNAIPLPKKNWQNDLALLSALCLLYANAVSSLKLNSGISYHVISPLIYCAIVVLLANNKGIFARALSVKWVQIVGKASFYTYLLHCVVIELLHLYLDKVTHWQYNPFDNPLATILIIIILYGSCASYSMRKTKRKL